MKIYFLSGLGADRRVFKHLTLPSHSEAIFIDWLPPARNETLQTYARRIAALINTSKPFALIGLSFGGILAMEVLEYIKPSKTIIISSVTNRRELPFYYRWAGVLKLNKLVPENAGNQSNIFMQWFFGIKSREDKALLNEILKATDTRFSKWAVNEILNWKRKNPQPGVTRIHGNRDRILPLTGFNAEHVISGGGHFMIVNRAKEISDILTPLLCR